MVYVTDLTRRLRPDWDRDLWRIALHSPGDENNTYTLLVPTPSPTPIPTMVSPPSMGSDRYNRARLNRI